MPWRKKLPVDPYLKHYDPNKPLTLQTDESLKGLCAVLPYRGSPNLLFLLASSNIKKHMLQLSLCLVVARAMEKFHHFLFIWNVLVKSLIQAISILQCLLLRILPYNFSVNYIKGLNNQLADCLARWGPLNDKIKLPNVQVHAVSNRPQAIASRIQFPYEVTVQDDDLCSFKHIGKLDGQAKFKKCHQRSSFVGISMRKSSLKMDFYTRGQELSSQWSKDNICLSSSMQAI